MSIKKRLIPTITAAGMLLTSMTPAGLASSLSIIAEAASDEVMNKDVKLENDMEIAGDLYITAGTFEVNGHTLTVGGSIYQSGGDFNVNDSTVKVGGNYELQNEDGTPGTGYIISNALGSVLDVDGDVVINTTKELGHLVQGTLKIGGDFTVKSPEGGANFTPISGHVTEFKGDKTHTVEFENDKSFMNLVSMSGEGQILLKNTRGFTLASDVTLAGGSEINGSSRELAVNGHTLTVDGDFIQNGETVNAADKDENKSLMQVNGNYYHTGGTLNVNNGTVKVSGNYELQYKDGTPGTGYIVSNAEGSVLDVDGDVVINTTKELGHLVQGTLKIGGDFTVKSPEGGAIFTPISGHVTEFKSGKAHKANIAAGAGSMNIIQLGTGDSLEFTGSLNGIAADETSEISLEDTTLASIAGNIIKAVKAGKTDIVFKNSANSSKKTLVVENTDSELPDEPSTTEPAVTTDKPAETTETTITTTSVTITDTTADSSETTESSAETTSISVTTEEETTTAVTEETTASTEATTASKDNYFASADRMREMAVKDYRLKTGVTAAETEFIENEDSTVSIRLIDENGNELDTYTIDPVTGIGKDSNGGEINLPQTGNNVPTNLVIALSAFMLTIAGAFVTFKSGIIRRKSK